MASFILSLSTKSREDGKRQVLVRVSSGRGIRFRVKSSVYVSPEYWDEEKKQINVPVSRKINRAKVDEAKAEKANLDIFIRDLSAVIDAAQDCKVELNPEWIDHVFSLTPMMQDPLGGYVPNKSGSIYTTLNIERAEAATKLAELEAQKQKEEEQRNMKLYDVIPAYCKSRDLSASRVKQYKVLGRLLGRYEMFVQLFDKKRKDFSLDMVCICPKVIEDFRDYIRNEGSLQEQYPKIFKQILSAFPQTENPTIKNRPINDRGDNYIVVTMKRLKALVNWCIETDRMQGNPFKGVTIGSETYGSPIYITMDECETIANFDLTNESQTIQQQRDIFIFQCCVGCRVSDLYLLTTANIIDGMIRYVPIKTEGKTRVEARVPLDDLAKSILAKYKDATDDGRIFPFVSKQRYNDAIKDILRLCGITRNVIWRNPTTGKSEVKPICDIASSHMARRTFVGGIYKKVQDPNVIGAMSGHAEGSKSFVRYRDIEDDVLRKVITARG